LAEGNALRSLIMNHGTLTAPELPPIPYGVIKSFGKFGPKYQVGQALRPLDHGDWIIEVTLVETGEKVEYRLARLQNDPEAS
jgi:hypothetical protein